MTATETYARRYCADRCLQYLSHEVYGDQIWIAVEQGGDRWEEKVAGHLVATIIAMDRN